jgi:hypothetical protein
MDEADKATSAPESDKALIMTLRELGIEIFNQYKIVIAWITDLLQKLIRFDFLSLTIGQFAFIVFIILYILNDQIKQKNK